MPGGGSTPSFTSPVSLLLVNQLPPGDHQCNLRQGGRIGGWVRSRADQVGRSALLNDPRSGPTEEPCGVDCCCDQCLFRVKPACSTSSATSDAFRPWRSAGLPRPSPSRRGRPTGALLGASRCARGLPPHNDGRSSHASSPGWPDHAGRPWCYMWRPKVSDAWPAVGILLRCKPTSHAHLRNVEVGAG
jgi:hypothetical protein